MIALLSPAKTLDMQCDVPKIKTSKIRFAKETAELAKLLKTKSSSDISGLMKLSEKLSDLNFERFQNYKQPHPPKESHPAGFAFRGDVYQGLDIDTLSENELLYANDHLRILSGFYGILRPFDLIMAYRLEMGTRLKNNAGKDLYDYWGSALSHILNKDIESHSDKTIINLASIEYSKAIVVDDLAGDFLNIEFKEQVQNKFVIKSFFAKKARGSMARWICQNQPQKSEDLKQFNSLNYKFNEKLSNIHSLVFTRNSP